MVKYSGNKQFYGKRKDPNHDRLCEALAGAGYDYVETYRMGFGFPDILAWSKSGIPILIEAKGKDSKTKPGQVDFANRCKSPYVVIRDSEIIGEGEALLLKIMAFWDQYQLVDCSAHEEPIMEETLFGGEDANN